jgi:hypothetical protein
VLLLLLPLPPLLHLVPLLPLLHLVLLQLPPVPLHRVGPRRLPLQAPTHQALLCLLCSTHSLLLLLLLLHMSPALLLLLRVVHVSCLLGQHLKVLLYQRHKPAPCACAGA